MNAWRRVQSRIRAADPLRFDIAVAALFIVAWLFEIAFIANQPSDERLATGVLGVLALLPLAVRRRAPILASVWLASVCIASEAFGDSFLVDDSSVPFVAFFFLLYTLGRHLEGRRLLIGAGALIVGLLTALTLESAPGPADVLWVGFLLGAPVASGRTIRNRHRLNRELRAKAERAERERERHAAEAIERERARIATELQAVVANGVSAMVVQAEAVPRLLEAGDPGRATQSLAVIEETGRDALGEMRRLLGVLRRDEDGADLAPQPSLRRVEALVARCEREGLAVDLEIDGGRAALAPGVDLAAYRVLEQSLRAAHVAQANGARVRIRYAERDLELEVSDDRPAGAETDSGELAALRERLSIYGGHLRAAERDGGGYGVRARLPRGAT